MRGWEFLQEMERVVLWSDLLAPYMSEGKRGRPPFAVKGMLRIDLMQQWLTLSDPAMEEALHDVPLFREFAGAQGWDERLPEESTIPRFRHVLKKHMVAPQILQAINDQVMHRGLLKSGIVVGAILITASSSTKNAAGERAPEMKQSSKGQHLYFGMKCHIRVDAESGLVHTVRGKIGHVNGVVQANSLLHRQGRDVFADAGYQGA